MIGSTISHYKILEKLGEGGMGVVYKAQDTKLDRLVALKFLPRNLSSSGQDRARFLQEAKAAAALSHPNICTIYGIEEHDDEQFIVMEFVDGETLRKTILNRQLPIDNCIAYATQIGDALSAAHEKEITHRDIKPDNIMINSKNQIKVMDFGLAKLKGGMGLTRSQSTLGTTAYMSPEQMQSAEVDNRTDIWSFGVVLYEMLAGRLPFRGEHQAAMVYSITNEEPQPILTFRRDVSSSLQAVLAKALEKDKSCRYENVQQFLTDLRQTQMTISIRKQGKSIAVLPLTNMSANVDDEYFSDGMTEDIIAQLSKIASLKVISRTSVMRYKKTEKSVKEIAAELGASHVVEGSVRRAANRLRIVAQLIDATNDTHLWAETFDRNMTDIFAIQTEVAEQIAVALQSRFTADERARVRKRPTDDMESYRLYLLGRHYWNQAGQPNALEKAIACFTQAIERDPEFARAYAMLALVYCWHGGGYFGVRPRDASAKILMFASKALELDPDVAEAHHALAYVAGWHRYDWDAAQAHFKRTFAINPNSADAMILYAFQLLTLGRTSEALEVANRACELDPVSIFVRGHAVCFMSWARRHDESVAALQAVEAQLGDDYFLNWCRTMVMIGSGRASEIVPSAREWRQRVPVTLSDINLAHCLAASGEVEAAREILSEIHTRETTEYVWPTGMGQVYAQLGDKDRAFAYLERAYEDRAGLMILIACDSRFDSLRGDPRFESIVRRVGAIRPQS